MKDEDKTKKQLISELAELRKQNKILKASETKYGRVEEEIKESEEKYRMLFENSTDFVFTLDLKGNFKDVNKAAEHLTGHTKAELVKMNFRDYTPSNAHKKIFQAFNKLYKTGETLQDFPFEVIVKNGIKKYFEISAVLLRKEGKVIKL